MKAQDPMYLDLATRKTAKVLAFAKLVAQTSGASTCRRMAGSCFWRETDSSSSDIALVENFR